jgi:hypothetical protein
MYNDGYQQVSNGFLKSSLISTLLTGFSRPLNQVMATEALLRKVDRPTVNDLVSQSNSYVRAEVANACPSHASIHSHKRV